jgi:hypothetical protein
VKGADIHIGLNFSQVTADYSLEVGVVQNKTIADQGLSLFFSFPPGTQTSEE